MNGRMERDRRDLEGRLESQSAQVSAWIETEDKKLNGRFDEKVGRTQEALNTFGKRMDERFDAQDRAVKKIEADGRATSARAWPTWLRNRCSSSLVSWRSTSFTISG